MERKPKSGSCRKAVQTAQNIIQSRTGNAIIKQAYRTADKIVEKKASLIEHKKGKEMRKLTNKKVQFIHEQNEKLRRKVKSDGAQTSEKDFAEEENYNENLVTARSPKSSLRREKCNAVRSAKEKENQSEGISPTRIEVYELEYSEKGEIILPVKAIRKFNEEARKRGRLPENEIEVRTTNFYPDYDQIESWLNAIERENLRHLQRMARSDRKKNKTVQNGDVQSQHAELSALEKLNDDKGFLKLPKIISKTESSISCRTKSVKMESLDDPRFTKLLDSLTPVKNTTLTLTKVPKY